MSQIAGAAARRARRQEVLRHYVRGSLAMVGGFAAAAVILALVA